jgi:hypothetical protein
MKQFISKMAEYNLFLLDKDMVHKKTAHVQYHSSAGTRETGRDRERQGETETDRDRQRERERERETDRERERESG